MDSKEFTVDGTELRVSVLETTSPATILDRKDSLMASMVEVAKEDGADQVLLFVIDILKEEATLLIPNDLVKTMAEKSFGVTVTGDTTPEAAETLTVTLTDPSGELTISQATATGTIACGQVRWARTSIASAPPRDTSSRTRLRSRRRKVAA